ncbi:protein FRG1 homolog [Malaya genurostris]|uniref:protein FRG1 homolog n=1 Tax=Malaya genurostris TaxID=325434 RepID=UPI0026F3EB2C|nr:protein FRG1 homolog [Malaya genurostris]XP_058448138.1 protein FRG1 homolog [Malaya genurostris]
MSEYSTVKSSKLVLKGESSKNSKRKHKKHKRDKEGSSSKRSRSEVDEDAQKHGGWWKVTKVTEITGSIAIQFGKRAFIKALDNGMFTLGAPHNEGDGPDPEEIFTAVLINEEKVAFKSGYGKYLKAEKDGMITGRSDAVSAVEQFEPVFEGSKMALLAANGCFVSVDPEDDAVVAIKKKVGDNEVCVVRSCAVREQKTTKDVAVEEQGDLDQVEINYVKKFQKFQDKRLRVNTEDKAALKQAQVEGALHEALLDRRSKMKADRYCK